jgi:hypothetical protein
MEAATLLEGQLHDLLTGFRHQGEWFACGVEEAVRLRPEGFVWNAKAAHPAATAVMGSNWVLALSETSSGRRAYTVREALSQAEVGVTAHEAFVLSGFTTKREFNARNHLCRPVTNSELAEKLFVSRRLRHINNGRQRRSLPPLQSATLSEAMAEC